MKNLVFLFCALTLAIAGCSGSQSGNNELSIMMNEGHADAWINLMPGSQQTFFITGTISLKNYGDITINSIKIMKCIVSQGKHTLYEIIPDLKDSLGSLLSVEPGQMKDGIITSKGVELENGINSDKPVDLTLFLISSNNTKQVMIPGVKITKVH